MLLTDLVFLMRLVTNRHLSYSNEIRVLRPQPTLCVTFQINTPAMAPYDKLGRRDETAMYLAFIVSKTTEE